MQETDYLKENLKALDLLKRIERFKLFSEENLQSFLKVGKLKSYEAGETIVRRGAKENWVYFLISGQVKVVKGENTFAILQRSGDLFGEMAVIDQEPRSASVWALTKTMLLGLDCSNLDQVNENSGAVFHYTIFRLFAESLAERLRITNDEVIKLQKKLHEKDKLLAKLRNDNSKGETLWL
ncbi:MAG: cyclic nucleotide-binding domain-containing protein [Deltaproteobacteria bacterium]|nr:cyclic nucleotide-binding domain-containing protein [Deltaproteobacteria bacterium]